ncbi:MAG: hypothetical protein ACXWZF_06815 [Actinomycetota bacterium]
MSDPTLPRGDAREPLAHVAINGGGDAAWGEPMTDEEYAEGF